MKHILLIDNHPLFRVGLEIEIKKLVNDPIIKTASDTEAGNILLKNRHFDIVILGINHPDNYELDILRLMIIEQPHLKIMIFSDYDVNLVGAHYKKIGASVFVPKSSRIHEIQNVLKLILDV